MSIKNVKKTSNKIALAIGGLAIVGCTSLYAINMNSFKQLDKNGEHKIEWRMNDQTYVEKNGEWFIYENNKARPMTVAEMRSFEEQREALKLEMLKFEKEMELSEKKMAFAEEEMARSMREMERAHEEMTRSFDGMEQAFIDFEQSQLDIQTEYLEGNLSKKEFEAIQKELKKAQQQLKNNQDSYQREIQRAKEQFEKSRRQLEIDRENFRVPPVPKLLKGEETRIPAPASAAIPMSTFPPHYPADAVKSGIEGYVKMQFDLDKDGSPTNIQVIEASPEKVFEKEAVSAIKKWSFKTDGKPLANMRYTLDFRMQ